MARLDTKNGKAEFVPELGVKRNGAYVIVLNSDGNEVKRLERPGTLESIAELLDGVADARPTIAIEYPNVGKLTDDASLKLSTLAIAMLRTSDFNSTQNPDQFDGGVAQIQSRYRKALSGSYLVVTFKLPRKFKTTGGEIMAGELVIGLGRNVGADALFTIDIEGRVVEHTKYRDKAAAELLDAVKDAGLD